MVTDETGNDSASLLIIEKLLKIAQKDTVYRDVYLMRAQGLMSKSMDAEGYRVLLQEKNALNQLPHEIRLAMEKGEWEQVHELTGRLRSLQRTMVEKSSLFELGRQLYEPQALPLDPFSPGLQALVGVDIHSLNDVRNTAVGLLESLESGDVAFEDFYRSRRENLKSLSLKLAPEDISQDTPEGEILLKEEALDALNAGELKLLEQISGRLSQKGGMATRAVPIVTSGEIGKHPEELLFPFSKETLDRARRLGLSGVRVESWEEKFATICHFVRRHAWLPPVSAYMEGEHPLSLDDSELPADTPEALKGRLELFVKSPLVNSGGARYLPYLVPEDLLVEDFQEPAAGQEMSSSGLLDALGLKSRNQLSRLQIEQVLLQKGSSVLENELKLDPLRFRLVCIPPDIYLRLGQGYGWGNRKLWTHFDGYQVFHDGHMRPLAGGDVRFGGIYDMVSIGKDYASDRVILRLAVVQRKRFSSW